MEKPELAVCRVVVGIDGDHALEASDRTIHRANGLERDAHVVPAARELRIELDSRLEARDGFVQASQHGERRAATCVRFGTLGGRLEDGLVACERVVEPARLAVRFGAAELGVDRRTHPRSLCEKHLQRRRVF